MYHLIRPEGTMMNGFLFNAGLILLTSVAVVQFLTDSFTTYLRGTASTCSSFLLCPILPFFRDISVDTDRLGCYFLQ
jgi:hypothetical protein